MDYNSCLNIQNRVKTEVYAIKQRKFEVEQFLRREYQERRKQAEVFYDQAKFNELKQCHQLEKRIEKQRKQHKIKVQALKKMREKIEEETEELKQKAEAV